MGDEWKKVCIEDIAAKKSSAIAMGPFGSRIKTDNFVPKGVPVIRGVNLKDERFCENEFVFLTENKADELRSANVFHEDIVFTHRGTLGQVGIIPKHSKYPRYVISQSQMKLSCDKKVADPLFIFYFFKSPCGQHQLLANTSSTGVPAISRPATTLKNISLLLPPLSEQQAISKILGNLDDKIELNRKMNESLESIAQALFQSWFVDFDPVIDKALAAGNPIPEPFQERAAARQALGDLRKPLPQDIAQHFPDEFEESELGWIPKGWVIKSLRDCCSELRRGPPPQYTNEEGIKVVNQKCIRNHRINFHLCKKTKQSQESIGSRILQRGDVLINSTGVGTLGRVAQIKSIKELTTTDSHVTIVRPNPKIVLPWWLGRSIIQLESLIVSMGEGSTGQTELNRSRLGDIEILVPVMELQFLFENILNSHYQNQSVISEQEYSLQQIRDTLLPKLISGDIRIPDAEKLVAEVI